MTKKNGKNGGKKGQKKRRSDRVPFSPWAGVGGAAIDPFDDAPEDTPAVAPPAMEFEALDPAPEDAGPIAAESVAAESVAGESVASESLVPEAVAVEPEPARPALIQLAAAPRGAASLNVVSNGRKPAPSVASSAAAGSAPVAAQHNPAPASVPDAMPDTPVVPLSPEGCTRLAAYLAAVTILCLFGVAMNWPESAMGEVDTALDQSLLLLAVFSGGLGACIHAVQSFTTFMGNRQLGASWVPWYVLRPLIGMSLAFLGYVIVRVGLIPSSPADVNPAGIAAIGGLAGLFAKRALQKLAEISDTVFRVQHPHEEKDALSPGSAKVPTRNTTSRGS